MTPSRPLLRRAHAAFALAALASLAACHDPQVDLPTRANFTAAVQHYLAERGHLCLGQYDWPIVVTQADDQARARAARQLALLESLGLAAGSDVTVTRDGAPMRARQYALTDAGRAHYLHVPVVVATATQRVTHAADVCVATLALDRVIGWETPATLDGRSASSVLFTYRVVDPAPWLATPDARRAFPLVERAIANAGTMQLRLGVHLGPDGWIADELTD